MLRACCDVNYLFERAHHSSKTVLGKMHEITSELGSEAISAIYIRNSKHIQVH